MGERTRVAPPSGEVGFAGAGITLKVFARAKLEGIDEDTDGGDIALSDAAFDECGMPGMESPHGRKEPDAIAPLTGLGGQGGHFRFLLDDLQATPVPRRPGGTIRPPSKVRNRA